MTSSIDPNQKKREPIKIKNEAPIGIKDVFIVIGLILAPVLILGLLELALSLFRAAYTSIFH